jgi:hypothetical protein
MSLKEGSTSSPEIPCLLWNDRQVAAAVGMSVKRIQELARLGLLPGFKVGRNWQFDPEALRSWIKRNGGSKEAQASNARMS